MIGMKKGRDEEIIMGCMKSCNPLQISIVCKS
jgi:hypothetical protein